MDGTFDRKYVYKSHVVHTKYACYIQIKSMEVQSGLRANCIALPGPDKIELDYECWNIRDASITQEKRVEIAKWRMTWIEIVLERWLV
jgi:hypothetical protein